MGGRTNAERRYAAELVQGDVLSLSGREVTAIIYQADDVFVLTQAGGTGREFTHRWRRLTPVWVVPRTRSAAPVP